MERRCQSAWTRSQDEVTGTGPAQIAGNAESRGPVVLPQHPTGITGLDQILRGGLPVGGAYLLAGTPAPARPRWATRWRSPMRPMGGTSIFATLLAETHDRMLAHLAGFSFLDPTHIGSRIHYLGLLS